MVHDYVHSRVSIPRALRAVGLVGGCGNAGAHHAWWHIVFVNAQLDGPLGAWEGLLVHLMQRPLCLHKHKLHVTLHCRLIRYSNSNANRSDDCLY